MSGLFDLPNNCLQNIIEKCDVVSMLRLLVSKKMLHQNFKYCNDIKVQRHLLLNRIKYRAYCYVDSGYFVRTMVEMSFNNFYQFISVCEKIDLNTLQDFFHKLSNQLSLDFISNLNYKNECYPIEIDPAPLNHAWLLSEPVFRPKFHQDVNKLREKVESFINQIFPDGRYLDILRNKLLPHARNLHVDTRETDAEYFQTRIEDCPTIGDNFKFGKHVFDYV